MTFIYVLLCINKQTALQASCVLYIWFTWHIVGESVCNSTDCIAHSHLTSLQYLLNNELPGVSVKTLGCVDVAWITENVQNFLTADLVFHRCPWTTTPCTKRTHPLLHQHTHRLLDLVEICVEEENGNVEMENHWFLIGIRGTYMCSPSQAGVWSLEQELVGSDCHCGGDECPLSPPPLQSAPAAAAHTDVPPVPSSPERRK